GEVVGKDAGVGMLQSRFIEHDEAAVLSLGGQGVLEGQRAYLLGKTDRVATRRGSERAAAAAEEIDPGRPMTCRAGALLPVHLFPGPVDFAAVLDVVRAALAFGELPAHAAMQDVRPWLEAKDRVRQFARPRRLAVERHDLEFHVTYPRPWPRVLPQAPLLPCR